MTTHHMVSSNLEDETSVFRQSLNDGREAIYFDDPASSHDHSLRIDKRVPETRSEGTTMRFDPLTDEWIAIAPKRNSRSHLPAKEACPLCPQTVDNLSDAPGPFDVVVFENKSPSFGPSLEERPSRPSDTNFDFRAPAAGRCEVVVFSPDHVGSFATLPAARVATVLSAWTHRTAELKALPGVESVFPFENRGEEIGVTLHHPHGQIYAYPFIPPRVQQVLTAVSKKRDTFFEDYVEFESSSERTIARTDNFVAFVPFAPRWPLEIVVMPLRAIADFTELTEQEREELVDLLPRVLLTLDSLHGSAVPYISAWYQAPVGLTGQEFRFHLRITSPKRSKDRLKILAGSETAMGAFILDVTPEIQAGQLRELAAEL